MSRSIATSPTPLVEATRDPIFSVEEWRAIEVALHDATRFPSIPNLSREGLLVRAWRWLTGFEPPRRLADPRLDAIRRFVWAIRRHGAHALEQRPELRRLGLSATQVAMLERAAA